MINGFLAPIGTYMLMAGRSTICTMVAAGSLALVALVGLVLMPVFGLIASGVELGVMYLARGLVLGAFLIRK